MQVRARDQWQQAREIMDAGPQNNGVHANSSLAGTPDISSHMASSLRPSIATSMVVSSRMRKIIISKRRGSPDEMPLSSPVWHTT